MGEEGEAKTDAKPEKVKIRRVHICNANGTPLFKHPESKHHESNTPEEQKLDNTLVFEKDLEETGLKAKLSEQFNIPLGQIVSVKPRSTHKAISNIREQKCPIPIPTHLFAKLKKEAEKYLNWGERHRGYMFVESNLYLELVDLHSNPPKSLFTILDYVRDSPAQSPADSQTAETTLNSNEAKLARIWLKILFCANSVPPRLP
ncbi:hypothetical protein DdX_11254 [Ditylenchus destructor]|uniref:Uncharacterized protein n=1 Tax=Ditylenchus destructor TaxID=166010 RepID=A0AAD4MX62_9BILA|nr:hypothetical protein DdX_11254 [Ditylenchus destructor]